jgi:cupin superfamily acireductone dioxygenase involved in methionine salvage
MGTPYKLMSPEQKIAASLRTKKWRAKNLDKVLKHKRDHYHKFKEKYYTIERDRQYKKRYNITLADYDEMLLTQGGVCKICRSDKAGNTGQCFAVDHCHESGKIRGLLCIKCNARLGWFEKNAADVAKYLQGT